MFIKYVANLSQKYHKEKSTIQEVNYLVIVKRFALKVCQRIDARQKSSTTPKAILNSHTSNERQKEHYSKSKK